MTIIISIGRNISWGETDEPMSQYSWDGFRGAVTSLVQAYAGPLVFAGTGEGIYKGDDEESFTAIGAEAIEGSVAMLKSELRSLAEDYKQESIAWTRGTTLFL